ncbi:hypothetical protein TrVE_jg8765 [Triparma verrucosa]|uniref:Uncharacterized protein n=1 Tax=Triparma verrucosa TaxID=1606542 RepID=A0A9W6Z6B7_9STRA|nr:hypothetical protein TrVE_jg8765 [Triparma verrucosa]
MKLLLALLALPSALAFGGMTTDKPAEEICAEQQDQDACFLFARSHRCRWGGSEEDVGGPCALYVCEDMEDGDDPNECEGELCYFDETSGGCAMVPFDDCHTGMGSPEECMAIGQCSFDIDESIVGVECYPNGCWFYNEPDCPFSDCMWDPDLKFPCRPKADNE